MLHPFLPAPRAGCRRHAATLCVTSRGQPPASPRPSAVPTGPVTSPSLLQPLSLLDESLTPFPPACDLSSSRGQRHCFVPPVEIRNDQRTCTGPAHQPTGSSSCVAMSSRVILLRLTACGPGWRRPLDEGSAPHSLAPAKQRSHLRERTALCLVLDPSFSPLCWSTRMASASSLPVLSKLTPVRLSCPAALAWPGPPIPALPYSTPTHTHTYTHTHGQIWVEPHTLPHLT